TSSDIYSVALTVSDDDSGTSSTSASVTVNNDAPLLINVAGSTITENGTATVTTNIDDDGTQDVWSVTVNWEGGPTDTISGLTAAANASGTVGGTTYTWTAATSALSMSHQYLDDNPSVTSSDIYSVALTVSDDDSGT